MILNKYNYKRNLGSGRYGKVILATDSSGKQHAIKLIPMSQLTGDNEYLLEYLQSQIACLKNAQSRYIMKLHDTQTDQNYKYLVCQYCNGGDLLTVQSKQPNKVFELNKARKVLSHIIQGLEHLHSQGSVHRDIKAQNILMNVEDGQEIFKLADFGFAKNIKDMNSTVLGTTNYMAPQIYSQNQYEFGVDMWSFGVLFYFMLNLEYPFKLPLKLTSIQSKATQLKRQAKNFSFKEKVKASRKKLQENCTQDMQDLFKQMLNPDAKARINFYDIRNHPVFRQFFPQQNRTSLILYKNGKGKNIRPGLRQSQKGNDNVAIQPSLIIPKNKKFPQQSQIMTFQTKKIQFLRDSLKELNRDIEVFAVDVLALTYNVTKYVIILSQQFLNNHSNQSARNRAYKGSKWTFYAKTQQYTNKKIHVEGILEKARFQFEHIYRQCDSHLKEIGQQNQYFSDVFQKQIKQSQTFQGDFKQSYRKSTATVYKRLSKNLRTSSSSGNKKNYQLALISIFHGFNKIFDKEKQSCIQIIFEDYFKAYNKTAEQLSFDELKTFLTSASAGQLNSIAKEIYQLFFKK